MSANDNFHVNLYGCGTMAQAIFMPFQNRPKSFTLHTYTPSGQRAKKLAAALGGKAYGKIEEMPPSPYAFLACKPTDLPTLAKELALHLPGGATVLSIMAGVSFHTLQQFFGDRPLVRAMPNTPCAVKRGLCLMACSPLATDVHKRQLESLFEQVSRVVPCATEEVLNRAMAVSGCGPAYLFELAALFQHYLESHGFDGPQARCVVEELFLGSSLLMEARSGQHSFAELGRQVTSKGGATQKALEFLREKGLTAQWTQAMDRAYQRAVELQ